MNQSKNKKRLSKSNIIKYSNCENYRFSQFNVESIKSIFEEKFFIEPNAAMDCKVKKNFKYLNGCYSICIYVTNIDFSIVLSRTGELLNILINQSTKINIKLKNQNSSKNEFGWMPVVKIGIFEKIFQSININHLKEIIFNILQLSLIDKIQLINANYFKFNGEIAYKLDLNGVAEFLILTDDSYKLIDILSENKKSEYSNRIREVINTEGFKFKTQLI